jgi:hypothetical protein
MRNLHHWAIVLCVACSMQGLALAQAGGRPDGASPRGGALVMPPIGLTLDLLQNKKVQEELKLTAEQEKDIFAGVRKVRANYLGDPKKFRTLTRKEQDELFAKMDKETLKDIRDVIKDGLKPAQAKRLKQIEFQAQWRDNPHAFLQSDVARQLQLTDKQKKRIATILDQLNRDRGAALFSGKREEIPKLSKKAMEDIRSSLDDGQKKKLEHLTGKPFAFAQPSATPGKPGGNRPGDPVIPGKPGGNRPGDPVIPGAP